MLVCFAIKRGEITYRLDPFYNLPEHRALENQLLKLAVPVLPISNQAVSSRIVEGRVTPLPHCYTDDPQAPVFLRAQNIEEGFLNFADAKRLTPEAFDEEPEAMLADGDVVLTIDGVLLGKAAVHRTGDDPCCVSNHMVRILHGTRADPDYLTWFLNSPTGQKQIKRGITGSAIPGIRTDAIGRILVPLPPPQTQRQLVAEMQGAREARNEKLRRADGLLASLDAYLLGALNLKPLTRDARNTFAIRLRSARRDDRLNADYFHPERIRAIKTLHSTTSSRLVDVVDFKRDQFLADASENYVGLAHVQSDTGELVTADEKALGPCFGFQKDDVLFARLRPYLNKVYLAECSGVCSTEFHVMRIRDRTRLLPDYLATMLRSSLIVAQTRHMMTGNTHPRLANDDVVNLVIPIPSSEIQQQIATEVRGRREQARRLRSEAEADWATAKRKFEDQLLVEH